MDRGAGQHPPVDRHDGLIAGLLVPAGGHHDLVLEISDQALPDSHPTRTPPGTPPTPPGPQPFPTLDNCLEPRDARRSYAVLRGLTSASGGMVAAATTSLPERAEAGRNYDYRYVWIRDQCYAGQAAAAAGAPTLLDDAVRFVTARILDHGPDLEPAYTTQGAAVPDQRTLDLPGYPGGKNLIGNWVNQQFQLDAFGEALLLLAAAGRADRLDTDHWKAADRRRRRHHRPVDRTRRRDLGDRQPALDPQPADLRRRAPGHRADSRTPAHAAGDWLALADRITADTAANAMHPSGRWQRSPQDPRWTPRCCCRRCAAPSPPTTRAPPRPSPGT